MCAVWSSGSSLETCLSAEGSTKQKRAQQYPSPSHWHALRSTTKNDFDRRSGPVRFGPSQRWPRRGRRSPHSALVHAATDCARPCFEARVPCGAKAVRALRVRHLAGGRVPRGIGRCHGALSASHCTVMFCSPRPRGAVPWAGHSERRRPLGRSQ